MTIKAECIALEEIEEGDMVYITGINDDNVPLIMRLNGEVVKLALRDYPPLKINIKI